VQLGAADRTTPHATSKNVTAMLLHGWHKGGMSAAHGTQHALNRHARQVAYTVLDGSWGPPLFLPDRCGGSALTSQGD
jgi:hypothetical protein